MNSSAIKTSRIDINYALLQGVFWMANASIGAFSVVYLTYRGLSNSQIGISTSLNCFIAIIIQIIVAKFLDQHLKFPIKFAISFFFLIGVILGVVILYYPMGSSGIIIVFALCCAILSLTNGFISAQMMQFSNVGIPANFGWPRGVGSLCYSLSSYFFGALAAKYTEGILPVFFVITLGLCIVLVLAMPNPYKYIDPIEYAKENRLDIEQTSYKTMLIGNKLLLWSLISIIVYSVGQSAILTYTVRVIEKIGYGTAEYGVSEFIRAGVEVPMLIASVWVLKKMSAQTAIVISIIASGIRGIIIAFATSLGIIYGASALNILCSGIYVFASVIFVNDIVRPTEKVRAQSLAALFYSIGSVIGNFLSGQLIDVIGMTNTMTINGIICILSGIMMFVVGWKAKTKHFSDHEKGFNP